MLTVRSFILDGVALLGVVMGVAAGLGGYLLNLPELPERIAVVSAGWSEPETTGSITPRKEPAAAEKRGRRVRSATPAEVDAEPSKGWVDPFYRRRDR